MVDIYENKIIFLFFVVNSYFNIFIKISLRHVAVDLADQEINTRSGNG